MDKFNRDIWKHHEERLTWTPVVLSVVLVCALVLLVRGCA